MADLHFEPFGEPVAPVADKYALGKQGPVQRAVLNAGVGVFWLLVAGIVIARAVYFNPNIAETFVASLSNCLRSVMGS